jgi:hypothetical protein
MVGGSSGGNRYDLFIVFLSYILLFIGEACLISGCGSVIGIGSDIGMY